MDIRYDWSKMRPQRRNEMLNHFSVYIFRHLLCPLQYFIIVDCRCYEEEG